MHNRKECNRQSGLILRRSTKPLRKLFSCKFEIRLWLIESGEKARSYELVFLRA